MKNKHRSYHWVPDIPLYVQRFGKFIKYICWVDWGRGSLKNGKINSENKQPICIRLHSCSRCSNDVSPGCSHGGLSPIRLYQAAPQPTPAHSSSETTWCEPPMNCGFHLWPILCIVRKQWGWRTQMEVHLKANSNKFGIKHIDFPLSLTHVSGQYTLLFFARFHRSALSIHQKQIWVLGWIHVVNIWAPVSDGSWVWEPAALCGQRQSTI